jgi:diacylglycerol kinase family enzyme
MVIHSPHAGRSAILAHALRALEHAGVEIAEVLPIAAVADGSGLVQQWKAKGIDLIVAAGGDGVVGSAARHALDGKLPLGILPLGTANDLARSVGIPQDISSAAQIIAAGTVCLIDLGLARPLLLDEPPASHPFPHSGQPKLFAHALTVGFSVQFAQVATNKAIRQRYGRLTYPFALWQAFKTYRPIDAEIHLQGIALRSSLSSALFPMIKKDHLSLSGRIAQVTAANAPHFLGDIRGKSPRRQFHGSSPRSSDLRGDELVSIGTTDAPLLYEPVPTCTQQAELARAVLGLAVCRDHYYPWYPSCPGTKRDHLHRQRAAGSDAGRRSLPADARGGPRG